MTKKYQVVGIGNAMVDILAHVDDAFLTEHGVEKGIMQLIDTDRATELYGVMGPAMEISGGSAANTIAGLAALGLKTAYVSKVKDDQLGGIFSHDIKAQGADFDTPLALNNHAADTGRCMVLVTPDGERSMNTYLAFRNSCRRTILMKESWLMRSGFTLKVTALTGRTVMRLLPRRLRLARALAGASRSRFRTRFVWSVTAMHSSI